MRYKGLENKIDFRCFMRKSKKNRKIFNLLDKRQLPPVKKIRFCDYVINNNSSLKNLKKYVKIVQNKI